MLRKKHNREHGLAWRRFHWVTCLWCCFPSDKEKKNSDLKGPHRFIFLFLWRLALFPKSLHMFPGLTVTMFKTHFIIGRGAVFSLDLFYSASIFVDLDVVEGWGWSAEKKPHMEDCLGSTTPQIYWQQQLGGWAWHRIRINSLHSQCTVRFVALDPQVVCWKANVVIGPKRRPIRVGPVANWGHLHSICSLR